MDYPQDHQQKDFLATLFPGEVSNMEHQHGLGAEGQQGMPMYPTNYNQGASANHLGSHHNHQQNTNPHLNMELMNLMQQGMEPQGSQLPYNPQALEQQFKLTQLQQLQQLQNQIFQQQIALISGQNPSTIVPESPTEHPRDRTTPYQLPTPGPSAEIRPQPNVEFIAPMALNGPYMNPPRDDYRMSNFSPMTNQYNAPPRAPTSAPEHIAFRPSPHSLQNSRDLDFDVSPITSPWLGMPPQQSQTNKRTAGSSGDEAGGQPLRKKQSPAIRPKNPNQKPYSSSSTGSTPLLRSSQRSIAGDPVGDTPSPVDLSMPPPAPPQIASSSSSSTISLDGNQPPSPNLYAQLTPVTPASIMNIERLGASSRLAPASRQPKADPKQGKAKIVVDPSPRPKAPKKITTSSLGVSPSLKPLLPAGTSPPLPLGISGPLPQPVVQVRKTSHKAAEQKRRDSLKTTFDDLRGLLPPIPLPSDEKFADEPILPGALPPRGPPKVGGEGPNKGVSKLQLLICGNEYIRQLKGRVDRRDEEIYKLRREIVRLRGIIGDAAAEGVEEELDLERDLDALELSSSSLDRGGSVGDDEVDEDGED